MGGREFREAYGVTFAKRVDVEEGERLVGFEELERGDFTWMFVLVLGVLGVQSSWVGMGVLHLSFRTLDDLAE